MPSHDDTPPPTEPEGELAIQVLAMPADTNWNGDIFGGWLLGQMDVAGGVIVTKVTQGRNVTVAIETMAFRKPVNVGDLVCIYAKPIRLGRTSVCVQIQSWVVRRNETEKFLVTEGQFTYVAIGPDGRPREFVKPA